MELELATTDDIIRELRRRRKRFLFVGFETSNRQDKNLIVSAAQGTSRTDLLQLLAFARRTFTNLEKDGRESDECT